MSKGYNLLISEAAELDIREAFLYYEEQSEKSGYRFERNVKSAMKGIKKAPLQNQVKYHEIRVKFLAKFPYLRNTLCNKTRGSYNHCCFPFQSKSKIMGRASLN